MADTAVSTLTIRVLLFASYAEALGREAFDLPVTGPTTVSNVLAHLRTLPGGDRLPARPLCAVNLSQAAPDTVLNSGDEIAVLPPLSGG